jgi:16S rRNA (guanine966-N2)-methyltransferase
MKITGGRARGIPIDCPPGDRVRPTTDQVRESLFSILKDLVPDARVLDLFAGSGSLGLEAASRGAASVLWVEQHEQALRRLRANAARLPPAGVDCACQVRAGDVHHYLKHPDGEPFDLIFADPPYDRMAEADAVESLLQGILNSGRLAAEGVLVLELRARIKPTAPPGWEILQSRVYGGTRLVFFGQL